MCGEHHHGMPTYAWDYPIDVLFIPERERSTRVQMTSETCIIDGVEFSIRGCIEIPVHGLATPFIWGMFVSIKQHDLAYVAGLKARDLTTLEPMAGELHSVPPIYPDADNLRCVVHIRPFGERPLIELTAEGHPLTIDQKHGLAPADIQRIAEVLIHTPEKD
jgi:hypothetical protein